MIKTAAPVKAVTHDYIMTTPEGFNWLATPNIRIEKQDGGTVLQQMYLRAGPSSKEQPGHAWFNVRVKQVDED